MVVDWSVDPVLVQCGSGGPHEWHDQTSLELITEREFYAWLGN
jgi:hypothetical protein